MTHWQHATIRDKVYAAAEMDSKIRLAKRMPRHRNIEQQLSASWGVLNLYNNKMREIWLAEQLTFTVKMKIKAPHLGSRSLRLMR